MSEYTLPFETSFSLYDPNGVRVYFSIRGEDLPSANAHINVLLRDGYTVQEPVPSEGERRYRITRYTKSHQRMDNGDALPVLNLWSDNGEYPQLSVWPTTYREDGTQVVSDIEHMFDMSLPLCDVTMRDKVPGKAWGHCDMVAIGVPDTDMNGEPKMTKGGHIKYRFHHIEGAGTKPQAQATSDSEAGDKPTTLKEAKAWAMGEGMGIPEEAATNAMPRLIRELFNVPQGQEKDFLASATNGKVDMLLAAYVQWADEWVNMAHHAAMEEQELPF